jgi:flagellar basal-body rod modification protein FlgD
MPSSNPISAAAILPPGNIIDTTTTASTGRANSTLTQNDFLKLLVAQMSAQDPLNPQSNTDFAAQMAQFSALQTSQATQSDMSSLQASQQVQQANGMIGRNVTLMAQDGTTPTGLVMGVQIVSGVPKIVVNGSLYDMSQVLAISASPITSTPPVSQPVTPPSANPPPATQPITSPALPYGL